MAKRAMDIGIAALALLCLSPLLLGITAAVRLTMGSPVLFRQQRPGLAGKPFEILKFRTMTEPQSPDSGTQDDAARLTRLGRLLRRTSLDELPELINVLKGEMSLVGPRPLLMQYLPLYTPEQARRHEVKPGMTGWAQVNGRNAISWEERFALDVWYVDNHSFALDCRILAMTIGQVISGRGVSAEGHATMPEFMGSPPRE